LPISIYIQVSEPWEMIGIDLMGPWKETKFGFKYLFTATDFFTKWVEAFPLREKSALEDAMFTETFLQIWCHKICFA